MTNFVDYSKKSADELKPFLLKQLKKWATETKKVHPSLGIYADLFTEYNFGGKMLRGCLVKLGYEIASGGQNKEILNASVAIEIFQTSILIHDDIIDLSPTRRGKPTFYKALGGDHHAISQAICIGDIGFFIASRLISNSKFPENRINRAVSFFAEMVIQTGWGEMLDVELPRLPKDMTEEAVLKIHKLKTSYYTFIYPLNIGAVLGGATSSLLKNFETFGENLGLAFQIQDDILGVFGDEKKLGKSVTSDTEEGKNTLLISFAKNHATNKQLAILNNYYGKGSISQKQHDLIKDVFINSKSLEYSKIQVIKYVEQAKLIIPQITKNKVHRELLVQLADFLVTRKK